MIHIRVDDNELNSQAEMACGLKVPLPEGDTYIDGQYHQAEYKADCQACNPGGPRQLGTPIDQLSGRPGEPGYEKFRSIAASWGHD